MCGIVGYVGPRPAADILIKGLRKLEYRGYDSAGIALFDSGKLDITKAQGKLENVEKLLEKKRKDILVNAHCGIGHTRWATHGRPNTPNAHPHTVGHIAIVHNGIIENYQEIKKDLIKKGYLPKSETDSEMFAFLVFDEMQSGTGLVEATRKSFLKLKGACSVVVMSEREPNLVVGARNGSPLVATVDPRGGAILASDAQPILEYAREIFFLENGDLVIGTSKGLEFRNIKTGKPIKRHSTKIDWSPEKVGKQGYDHYMKKEIYEQPTVLVDTLNGNLNRTSKAAFNLSTKKGANILAKAKEIIIVACGTSWHAAMVGKYWLEQVAKVPVSVELASEFRYRSPVLRKGVVLLGISQSGETADTLAVIKDVKEKKIPTLVITNVKNSTLSREADSTFYTHAGTEIGVAATKTFSAQLMVLLMISGFLAGKKAKTKADKLKIKNLYSDLISLPLFLKEYLDEKSPLVKQVLKTANAVQNAKGFFFIGRGLSFPIALEGALKLKEIAYIHSEGYAAGELKHGPIAMIDKDMVAVVISPNDHWRDKTVSNLEEVKARGAQIVSIGNSGDVMLKKLSDHWIGMPENIETKTTSDLCFPFFSTIVMQLFSYELAVLRGTDVDKPRNLAKSVTVE